MATINDDTVKEVLKLAHKLISPRSAMDATFIEQTDASNVNQLAIDFVRRILELAIPAQQHCRYAFTLRKDHVAYAIELFIKFDVIGYRHSYMLDNQGLDGSTDSEWDMNSAQDSDHESHDDHDVSDDESLASDEEEDDDTDDMAIDLDIMTPTFDEVFEPIEKQVKLSNNDFVEQVASQILMLEQNMHGIEFEDDAATMLKMAMYSYVVAKLRAM